MSSQLDRIETMLRALCAHLGVQADRAGNGHQEGVEGDGNRYTGVVSRFEHGWGFIECESMNRNFFVHYSDIEGTGMRSLDPGEAVSFELAPGKDGRPKAVRVRRQPGRASRGARSQGLPRGDAGLHALSALTSADEGSPLGARRRGFPGPEASGLPDDELDESGAPIEDEAFHASESRPGRK